ncbi:hypothetical protein UPYG_G00150630 [Umbra pygmaea]|uniref:LYRIC n=1 Tax=Umbra pygmaea TaxID=75934 RepID=A0ABD0WY48_UMBPY
MAEKWLDVASQQAELIAGRLNEFLSTGLARLHSELGVDLGVKPEIPPWVILLAACIGLLLMVALWASACRGLFRKRPAAMDVDETVLDPRQVSMKAGRAEEQKKKKRKPTEKKSQLNGRAVVELQEEVPVSEDNQLAGPHRSQTETENASEVKKTKKKQKQAVKESKKASSEVKEPEEVSGSWETKVSNKEKREQRRKDKTPGDGSGSPGGRDPLPGAPPSEQQKASPKAAAPVPGFDKKEKMKKGDTSKTKAEKTDVALGAFKAVSSAKAPVGPLAVTGEWSDLAPPGLNTGPDKEHWSRAEKVSPSAADGHQHTFWGKETEGGWTVIDAGIPGLKTTEIHMAPSTGLGHGTEAVEPEPELQWLSPSQVQPEDQWSGLNGGSPAEVEGGSDWSAPAEVWGNYEETPAPEAVVPDQALPEPPPTKLQPQTSEVEEAAPDGSGKSKKKKKKKKKQAEDEAVPDQESEEPIRELVSEAKVKKQPTQVPAAVEVRVEKPVVIKKTTVPITQVPPQPAHPEKPVKQTSLPAPAQKSPEESQASKPVMKKKRARKET